MVRLQKLADDDNYEEEYCDFRSPVGKIIRRLDTLCKKPKIDGEIEAALNTYKNLLHQQEWYLQNGIVNINFAEAGLFFQSCSILFGKKVDILWEQVLDLHTRLIQYDVEDDKQKGKKIDKEAVERLEARRNRYKRKKNFKLAIAETDGTNQLCENTKEGQREGLSSGIDVQQASDKGVVQQASNKDVPEASGIEAVQQTSDKSSNYSDALIRQQLKRYKSVIYHMLRGENVDANYLVDEKINTQYSNLPGWEHIEDLFEYNKEIWSPDRDNLLVNLRLATYGWIGFMRDNKIPLHTPFEKYKGKFQIYAQQFREKQAQKLQNKTLDAMADLHSQMEYLIQKIRESNMTNISQNTTNSDALPNEGQASPSGCSLKNTENLNNLIVMPEKLPSDVINRKLRLDSGYCETLSDTRSVCDSLETSVNRLSVRPDSGLMDSGYLTGDSIALNSSICDDNNEDHTDNMSTENETNSTLAHILSVSNTQNNSDDNQVNRHIRSDQIPSGSLPNTTVLETNDKNMNKDLNITREEEMVPLRCGKSIVIPKAIQPRTRERSVKNKERKKEDNKPPPNKRRKLSKKQLEKLLNSLIPPVGQKKFEQFFSVNYQPELGEGEIQRLEYASSDSEIENEVPFENVVHIEAPPKETSSTENAQAEIGPSQNDTQCAASNNNCQPNETVSTENAQASQNDTPCATSNSDHCQMSETTVNDSGFMDGSYVTQTMEEDNCHEPGLTEPARNKLLIMDTCENTLNVLSQIFNNPQESEENEVYKRLLSELKERDPDITLQDTAEKEESRKRVEEWRQTITPVLTNLKESDFDIHEYGTKIMENMGINETKDFKSIVSGKLSAEVVRYFISSLQLANTGNIEICGEMKGKLSNDSYKIKLLKKERHHEQLIVYHAPSEHTFRERLEQMRKTKHARTDRHGNEEPKLKKTKRVQKPILSRRPDGTPVHVIESKPRSGVTLRWAGSSQMNDPQPSDSYADDPCKHVQASLPSTSVGYNANVRNLQMFLNSPRVDRLESTPTSSVDRRYSDSSFLQMNMSQLTTQDHPRINVTSMEVINPIQATTSVENNWISQEYSNNSLHAVNRTFPKVNVMYRHGDMQPSTSGTKDLSIPMKISLPPSQELSFEMGSPSEEGFMSQLESMQVNNPRYHLSSTPFENRDGSRDQVQSMNVTID